MSPDPSVPQEKPGKHLCERTGPDQNQDDPGGCQLEACAGRLDGSHDFVPVALSFADAQPLANVGLSRPRLLGRETVSRRRRQAARLQ